MGCTARREENPTFLMLYVVGIILVVTSHCGGGGITLFTDWFSENSFHMQLFFFASGYFYKTQNENDIGAYFLKKIKHLLVPMYIYNMVYALLCVVLRKIGFDIGADVNFYSLFVSSFVQGSDYRFNSADWFVAQLFLVEAINIIISRICRPFVFGKKWVISAIYLFVGICAFGIARVYELNTFYLILCRTLFALSWYGIGRLYKLFEDEDRLKDSVYFSILFIVQLILLVVNEGNVQGSVVCFSFGKLNFISVWLSALTGIGLWLRLCKRISCIVMQNSILQFIGQHTFSIVENQYLGFWVVNTILYCMQTFWKVNMDFNVDAYRTMHNYVWVSSTCNNLKVIYVIGGIAIPLFISYIGTKINLLRVKKHG